VLGLQRVMEVLHRKVPIPRAVLLEDKLIRSTGARRPDARGVDSREGSGRTVEVLMLEYLERQKKLTANQWKIIATANVGDMLDFFDFFFDRVCTGVYT
jgi:hypothetical protein